MVGGAAVGEIEKRSHDGWGWRLGKRGDRVSDGWFGHLGVGEGRRRR